MNEDFASRAWIENRNRLGQGIGSAVQAIMESLRVLHDQQYSAPWRAKVPCRDSAKC